ncbi:hypothetical protein [Pelolinea submarina]|uniref:Uncharacterized protein n=1 Tax=Pelolinea submarina TaxID=913107 RepID=A0A347ZUZ9_9CHLR|nr:hypothetical protein [Pelolinea submarina]REG10285.1 hypothetical protein DFR64_0139 [Pelolinea submarina]BBB49130.1 hypothetical protein Pelsub_P2361 [Pelolinea submarina]
MTNKTKKFTRVLGYLAILGISLFVMLFVVSSSWIGYNVKNECASAISHYGGDCVEALSAQLLDESLDYGTRNSTTWALGEVGDLRALPVLESLYTGIIPAREPWNDSLSQYELKKAIKLIKGGFNLTHWAWRFSLDMGEANLEKPIQETVVMSDPSDAYYSLAQTIAETEGLVLADNLTQAIAYRPEFILWVATPQALDEAALWQAGDIFKDMDYYPALGIISGGTMEIAEQLWRNGQLTRNGENYLGSDVEVDQGVLEALIVDLNQPEGTPLPLTHEALVQTLQKSDYFYWVRHVSATRWMWDTSKNVGEDGDLTAAEVPALGPIVIQTPSCGSFQPWKEDSIAMGFINRGAAVYIGHVQTAVVSNSFLMRRDYVVPDMSTWQEFPLGVLAQVRSRMEARVSSSTPLYFMLGDPRAYLSAEQPYRIIADEVDGTTRRITGETDFRGYLAVKIADGADYDFVRISGLTAASESDFFFNNDLQTLNLSGDKYVVFYQDSGTFEITLNQKAPWYWPMGDGLVDALDYNWVTMNTVYNPFSLVFLAGLVILLLVKTRLKNTVKKSFKDYRGFFIAGFVLAVLHVGYVLLRMGHYTVSADAVGYTPVQLVLGFIGTVSSVSAGLILVRDARKPFSRFLGWTVAILPQALLTAFKLFTVGATDLMFMAQNSVKQPLWNFNVVWLSLIAFAIDLLLVVGAYQLIKDPTK